MPKEVIDNVLPERPRAVLRVGFAGPAHMSEAAEDHLRSALHQILTTIGNQVAMVTPASPYGRDKEPIVGEFFANECPLLRLVTGLGEPADTVAVEVLHGVEIVPPDAGDPCPKCLDTEYAAVLPFDPKAYPQSVPAPLRDMLGARPEKCAYIVALDGLWADSTDHSKLAKSRRAKARRAQLAVLIRHVDLLVAALDPDATGGTEDTMATVRAALAFKLPVVVIYTGNGTGWLIHPGDDFASVMAEDPRGEDGLLPALSNVVMKIVASPELEVNREPSPDDEAGESQGLRLLETYFDAKGLPPLMRDKKGKPIRRPTRRERAWGLFYGRFKKDPTGKSDDAIRSYSGYSARAKNLNYHFTGQYRGAFLMNYVLAVVTVALATLSLVLMVMAHGESRNGAGEGVLAKASAGIERAGEPAAELTSGAEESRLLEWTLLTLGLSKLVLLIFIVKNTHRANHTRSNDFAVAYRYLAERLRSLFYLPLVGSFQPPAAGTPQYTDRAIHQSAADWLFDTITRSVSPADLAMPEDLHTEHGKVTIKVYRPDARSAIDLIRDRWVLEQARYHHGTALTMGGMNKRLVCLSTVINWSVVGIVGADLLIVLFKMMGVLPQAEAFHGFAPVLVGLAALLPAAVAAMNGLRFQTECRRLAERSEIVRVILAGRPDNKAEVDPPPNGGRWMEANELAKRMANVNATNDVGAWVLDALLLTERIADDFIREVAEWSVLYAKEVPET